MHRCESGTLTASYEDTTFISGTTYTYQVCAYKGEDKACSDAVSIKTK